MKPRSAESAPVDAPDRKAETEGSDNDDGDGARGNAAAGGSPAQRCSCAGWGVVDGSVRTGGARLSSAVWRDWRPPSGPSMAARSRSARDASDVGADSVLCPFEMKSGGEHDSDATDLRGSLKADEIWSHNSDAAVFFYRIR